MVINIYKERGITLKLMKIILVSAIVFSSLLLGGCQTSDKQTETTKDVREIAWNSLGDSERKEVVGDWKDATVSKVTAGTKRFSLNALSFEGKEVTMVTFHSTNSPVLGDISK